MSSAPPDVVHALRLRDDCRLWMKIIKWLSVVLNMKAIVIRVPAICGFQIYTGAFKCNLMILCATLVPQPYGIPMVVKTISMIVSVEMSNQH